MLIYQGPIATARFPRNQKGFVVFVQNIADKLEGNTDLPKPTPSLAVYQADVDAFVAAQNKALDGSLIAVADRNAKALTVYQDVGHIVDYVQGIADSLPSAAQAIALILGAGLDVRKSVSRKKPPLSAKYTGISGEVLLVALAILGAGAYYWEFSVDQVAWSTVPETTKGKVLIMGLTPGRVYYFRFRTLGDKGKSDYSQVVSLLVH